jgi:hypothetical protein
MRIRVEWIALVLGLAGSALLATTRSSTASPIATGGNQGGFGMCKGKARPKCLPKECESMTSCPLRDECVGSDNCVLETYTYPDGTHGHHCSTERECNSSGAGGGAAEGAIMY